MLSVHKIRLSPNNVQVTGLSKVSGVTRFAYNWNFSRTRMTKNHYRVKSVADAGFSEFRRQLQYKTADHDDRLVVVDRWYSSSKTCSTCGHVKTKHIPLSIREWTCENCGTSHHRDINAAINLKNLAASFAVTACGEFLPSDLATVRLSSQGAFVNQESDRKSLTGVFA